MKTEIKLKKIFKSLCVKLLINIEVSIIKLRYFLPLYIYNYWYIFEGAHV